ncbi:hypothetical protein ScalyP_jg26 [Parmales sp. scaly parma]|nr:hypothetical protein ScalyP_jg26 [Parmales sp. scaly parma]
MRLFHDIVAQPAEGIEKDHHTKISARISLQQMYTTFVQQQVQQQQQTQPKKRSLLPIVDIAEFDTTIGDNEESAVSDSSSIIPNSTTSGCNDPPLCSEVNSYSTNNRGSSLKALDVLTNLIAIASTPTKQQIQNHSTIDSDLVGNEQGQGGTIPLFPSLMLPEEQISGSDCDSDSSCKDSSMSTKGSLTDLRACDSDSSSLSTPRSHSPQTPPIALFENLSPIDNFTSKNGYVNELAMLCRSPSKCRASATVLSEDPSSPKAAAVWATLTLFGPPTTTPTTNSFFELINNWENVVKETKAALKANVVKSGDSIVGEGVKSGRVLLRTTKKRVHTLSSEMIDSIKANPQYLSLRERGIWGNRENSATPIFEQEFKLVPFNELLGEEDDPPLVDVFMNYLKKIIEKQSNKRPLTS